jgi:O-antigen/teichoic acid export membrane protein
MTTNPFERKSRGFFWNTSVYLISTVFSVAVSILVLPIFTRHLSPADYGVVVLFVMFGSLLAGVISTNLHFASYRYYFEYKHDPERFKTLYTTNALFILLVFLFSGIVVHYLSGWISLLFFKGRLPAGLVLLSFMSGCFEYLVLYMTTLLTAQVKSMQYAAIIISRIVVNTACSFYFIFLHSLTYMALIYALIISQIITITILFIAERSQFGWRLSWADLKMSLRLAFPLVPNSMVGLVYSSFDKTMLSNLKNTDSVGYYSFGERFSLILKSLQDAVSKSWEPFFMNKAHEDTVAAREAIIKRFYEIAFLFMIIGISIIYYSEEMIKILTTKAFYPSMYVVPIYVYYYLFAIIGVLAMNQIQFSKNMAYLLPVSICSVFINVILNIVLIPLYGAVGAAGAIAISALASNLLTLYFGLKLCPLPLGRWRLLGMYLLLITFTVPVYLIMPINMYFIVKLMVKTSIIFSFVLIGLNFNYISWSSLTHVFGKIKGAALNITGAGV